MPSQTIGLIAVCGYAVCSFAAEAGVLPWGIGLIGVLAFGFIVGRTVLTRVIRKAASHDG